MLLAYLRAAVAVAACAVATRRPAMRPVAVALSALAILNAARYAPLPWAVNAALWCAWPWVACALSWAAWGMRK